MKTTCNNCGQVQESDMQRNGGKARWLGVSKAERSAILRGIAKAAWAKRKSNAVALPTASEKGTNP